MRAIGRFLGRMVLVLGVLGVAAWLFGPYEPSSQQPSRSFDVGTDIDAYLAGVEAAYDDITPGTEKRVMWADAPGQATEWSVVYVHGFSATSEEIRPVPDRVADGLDSNLIFTRLAGHGRGSDAMSEPSAQDWVDDLAEAMTVARAVSERILIISTSTGGTLVTALAQHADVMAGVEGLIFVSPNFGINNPAAALLGWPGARYWLPPLVGARRSFEPQNERHGTYWTTEYDSVAVMPMVALISTIADMDHGATEIPSLFYYSDDDLVVRPDRTAQVAAAWGGPSATVQPELGDADDLYRHVIAGDTLSPGQTDAAVDAMLDWARALGR
ncbi:MAG: alpha/beta fold hydrolase [Pseudomonadota bacterium]